MDYKKKTRSLTYSWQKRQDNNDVTMTSLFELPPCRVWLPSFSLSAEKKRKYKQFKDMPVSCSTQACYKVTLSQFMFVWSLKINTGHWRTVLLNYLPVPIYFQR